jgi:pimeloyl-ACP methyl ester carboxylesterase
VTLPRTFVLVHGAWGGGWVWRRVADRLIAGGHRVFTPTLTGLGDRSHLANADLNLTTHIHDVANLFRWEELADVVLVGHSYGGMVITGVTEAVPAGSIGAAVYLDAFLPSDGRALADYAPLAELDGFLVPPIPAAPPRTNAADSEWMNRLRTPQPRATFEEPVQLSGALQKVASKTYVLATGYDSAVFARFADQVRDDPSWRYHELACGHDVMLAMPDETVRILLEAAGVS